VSPVLGILGAGQLGRMLALEAHALGVPVRLLGEPDGSGAQVAATAEGSLDDPDAIERFARGCDVLTVETENVRVDALVDLPCPVWPPPAAIEASQDRVNEKRLFDRLGIPTAPWVPVASDEELAGAVEALGFPFVLKKRRSGFDGRGQVVVKARNEAVPAFRLLGEVPCIAEGFVRFDAELSVLVACPVRGARRVWPVARNVHYVGQLDYCTVLPNDPLQAEAAALGNRVADALGYVGVLTVETFVRDGALIANEIAPRVHNSGHWSIEGAVTSQFANHVRAVLGLPIGPTDPVACAATVNLLGSLPARGDVLAIPGAFFHGYGKSDRPGRKVGHATVLAPSVPRLHERLDRLRQVVGPRG
jgi:5-(carboxyamino)imidazole ribonucleotide synthase